MKELQVINEQEVLGKKFKIYGDFENPLFLAKDVAEWIDYAYADKNKGTRKVSQMVSMIDDDEKVKIKCNLGWLQSSHPSSHGGTRDNTDVWFLTEDGMYEVLMQSRKPIAKEFKKEVKKILKQIRTTGGYIANANLFVHTYFDDLDDARQYILTNLLTKVETQKTKISELTPQADYYQKLAAQNNNTNMRDSAKLFGMGQKAFIDFLLQEKYLYRAKDNTLRCYQQYINREYFVLKEFAFKNNNYRIGVQVLLTPKGKKHLLKKYSEKFAM